MDYIQYYKNAQEFWAHIPENDTDIIIAIVSVLVIYLIGFWRQTRTGSISDGEYVFRIATMMLLSLEFKLGQHWADLPNMDLAGRWGLEIGLAVLALILAYSGYTQNPHPVASREVERLAWLLDNMALAKGLQGHPVFHLADHDEDPLPLAIQSFGKPRSKTLPMPFKESKKKLTMSPVDKAKAKVQAIITKKSIKDEGEKAYKHYVPKDVFGQSQVHTSRLSTCVDKDHQHGAENDEDTPRKQGVKVSSQVVAKAP